jgi:two-component system C4-dicarboxylate transport response regulator DctD
MLLSGLTVEEMYATRTLGRSRRRHVSDHGAAAHDDDDDTRDSVVDALQDAGYTVTAAPGATAALRMMGEAAPALVVSDLRMPGMDGRELLTRTRQLLGSSVPPFVFLTGLAPEFADVAATFVSKPCDFDQLLGVVGRHRRA